MSGGQLATCCAYDPSGELFAAGMHGSSITVYSRDLTRRIASLRGHMSSVNALAWSSDSRHLISASSDQTAIIWDVERRHCRALLRGHKDSVRGCAWAPNAAIVATASGDTTAMLWDADTGNMVTTLEGHTSAVQVTRSLSCPCLHHHPCAKSTA